MALRKKTKSHKYNSTERETAQIIWKLRKKQTKIYQRWHDIDALISVLIKKLGGKYERPKSNSKGNKRRTGKTKKSPGR